MPRLASLLAGAAVLAAAPAAAQPTAAIPQEHAQMVAAFGGPMTGPPADFVARIGERTAQAAGKSGQCAFHLLNSEVVNAFTAPPGCHVYVTRGLLELVNTEGEVAAVIGHEIGHVAANHAGKRQQTETLAGIGAAVLGAVTKSKLASQIAGQVSQLGLLTYSRSQEYESDDLGVKYLAASHVWPPDAMVELLDALQRQELLQTQLAGGKAQTVPSWARDHPLTTERIARAAKNARAAGPAPSAETNGERAFLAAIDGLPYGADSQAQGYVDGQTFVHPRLAIGFTAPAGYALTNGDKAVAIKGPDLQGQFSGGALSGGLDAYAQNVLQQLVGKSQVQVGQLERTRINGLDAVILPAVGRTQNGQMVDVTVAAYAAAGGQGAYHFVTIAPQGRGRAATDPLIASFHTLTPAEAQAVSGGQRIQVVTVKAGDTAQSLADRMAFPDHRLEWFALLNAVDATAPLTPGQRVKLVVSGAQPPPAVAPAAKTAAAKTPAATALTSRPPSKPAKRSRR